MNIYPLEVYQVESQLGKSYMDSRFGQCHILCGISLAHQFSGLLIHRIYRQRYSVVNQLEFPASIPGGKNRCIRSFLTRRLCRFRESHASRGQNDPILRRSQFSAIRSVLIYFMIIHTEYRKGNFLLIPWTISAMFSHIRLNQRIERKGHRSGSPEYVVIFIGRNALSIMEGISHS